MGPRCFASESDVLKSSITVKKVAQGKYKVYKNNELVATAKFTPKYHPAPYLPKGFELTVKVKGKLRLRIIVRNILEGRRCIEGEFNK